MKNQPKRNLWKIAFWTLVVLVIVGCIVAYVVSLGTIRVGPNTALPPEFKDSKEEARRKHEAQKKELADKKVLEARLNRRYKTVYIAVRIILVVFWLGPIYFLYYIGVIGTLDDALNASEIYLLVILTANFITFGSIANMDAFNNEVKLRVENWVWRKHIGLPEEILAAEQELVKLEAASQAVPPQIEPQNPQQV